MKSVLLGGLKVFLVNDGGKPLSAPGGRAEFYVAGTSTPEPVYSDIDLTESTALGPIVYTDELGYLPPIWLKTDRLYKVQIKQKLPGSPDTWVLLWEVDNVGYIDPHESEEPGEQPIVVNSIAALKAVDHSEHGNVLVAGYYNAGDWGEPSLFIYDSESTASVDDGSVVRPNDVSVGSQGRWFQVFSGDVLDVRKFGAIPDGVTDVTAKVLNALSYTMLNSSRRRPITVGFTAPGKYFFNGGFDFTGYGFTDLDDASVHPVNFFFGEDVVLMGSGSLTPFELSKETRCLTREALVSYGTLTVEEGSVDVDPAWWGSSTCTIVGCKVKCHSVTTNDKNFTSCDVDSAFMLGGIVSLTNMNFKESWFTDDYDWDNLVISNVIFGVNDCISADNYIGIVNALVDNGYMSPYYGDLDGDALNSAELKSGFSISNARFNNVVIAGSGTIECCIGYIKLKDQTSLKPDLVIHDSGLHVDQTIINEYIYFGSLRISSSTINGDHTVVASILELDNCEVGTKIRVEGTVRLNSCSFSSSFEHFAMQDQGDTNYYLNGSITGCSFIQTYYLKTKETGATTKTYVNAHWIDNVSYAATAIDVSGIASHVNSNGPHVYEYRDNYGTFLPSSVNEIVAITDYGIDSVYSIDAMAAGTKAYVTDTTIAGPPTEHRYGAVYVEIAETYSLFSIGANESFVIDISVDLLSQNSGHGVYEPEFMDITVPLKRNITSNDGSIDLSTLKGYVSQYIYEAFIGTIDSATAHVNIRRNG